MIYCCKVTENIDTVKSAYSLCDAKRRAKSDRIADERKRALSITAGLLLRYCLFKNGVDSHNIKYHENGKPYVEDEDLFFSLSHSGEYAACVTSSKPVGIDIQQIVEIKDRTLSRFCTANELEYLRLSNDSKLDAIRFWALKESYLKASGCSTNQAFCAEFEICGNKIAKAPCGYSFELLDDIEGYVLAVCYAV